jgi:tetratricopeptide (TPR) repeat protein
MRALGVLVLLALAAAPAEPDRNVARAQAHLKRGREALDGAGAAKTTGQRLHALERAAYFLGRADEFAGKAADAKLQAEIRTLLVEALVRKAAAYYERKSLPRARETVLRALAIDPQDAKGKALLAAVKKAEDEDIFESVDGLVGIDRVKARRLAAGAPLRDRGLARRR